MTREDVVLSLVQSGELSIDMEGRIWRLAKRHGRGPLMGGGGYQKGTRTTPCARVRAEWRTGQGYLALSVMIQGRRTTALAHRVVWVFHRGAIPKHLTINHKNGVKSDNRPENLELATSSEQRRHALEVLGVRRNRPMGSRHPKTRLMEADVLEIRRRRETGRMVKDLAADFQMKPKAISAICRRRTWVHI